jgi:GNAT superfamily N-acetyltransferase
MRAKGADAPITIRPYQPDDLDACRTLWVELTDWHRIIYQSPDIGGDDPGHHFDEHLQQVGAENIWVAQAGDQVVGLAGMIPGDVEAELEPLVVSEPYRSIGIGQQLAGVIIEAARNRGVRQLTVRPVARNQAAIRFFHQMGFNILGHIELFVDFGLSDHQLWKPGERLAGRDFQV